MYTNKYNLARRLSYKVMERFPSLVRLKRPLMHFRLKSLGRRLEARKRILADSLAATGEPPLFDAIEIETINRCNGECGFCPVSRKLDPRPSARMPEELFKSIVGQLRELDFRGEVYLYSNNEPLLDTRIRDFAAHAKEALPDATLFLSTNATLLTPDIYRDLIQVIDVFTINNYCDDFKLTPGVEAVKAVAEANAEWWSRTNIVMRYRGEIKTSRGGQAPNKKIALPATLPVGCYFPLKQMVVRPDGKLSLCCNDALGSVTLGDLTRQTILDAWHSDLYSRARTEAMSSRTAFPICRHCDTLPH